MQQPRFDFSDAKAVYGSAVECKQGDISIS
jgi:hypothetical protein